MQDLEEELDDIIADLKVRMETACQEDNIAREDDRAAVSKMKLLPEVMTLLNRQNIQHAILDPETNFLLAVKYFLEPLRADGSLPAYNIQREIFTALTKMPIEKEALSSSGIGQVVLFYTKTKRAQPEIKRMAERLMGEWSRPILQRTDDYKKRQIEARYIDPEYVHSHPHVPLENPHALTIHATVPSNTEALAPSRPPRHSSLSPTVRGRKTARSRAPCPTGWRPSAPLPSSPCGRTPTAPAPPACPSATPSPPSRSSEAAVGRTTGPWAPAATRRSGRSHRARRRTTRRFPRGSRGEF